MAGKVLSKLRTFFSSESGNVAVTTAIVLVPMLSAAGAAVDYSRLIDQRTKLQNVVDSAALAGGVLVRTSGVQAVKREVRDFIEANMPDSIQPTSIKIEPDPISGKLMVRVSAMEPTTLMAVAGIEEMPYKVSAGINLGALHLNVALVIDSSGSMGWSASGPQTQNVPETDTRLFAAKTAATTFVEQTYDELDPQSSMRVSLTGFNQHVNVGKQNAGANWLTEDSTKNEWDGCVGSRLENGNVADSGFNNNPIPAVIRTDYPVSYYSNGNPQYIYSCPQPVMPLTDDRDKILDSINNLSAGGLTYIAAGAMLGIRTLTANKPFTESNIKLSGPARNILIIMTDGDNTVARPNNSVRHTLFNEQGTDTADLHTNQACTLAKNFQMDVYTISFGNGVGDDTKKLLQGCASSPDNYFDAQDGASLVEAFRQISDEVSGLVLSN